MNRKLKGSLTVFIALIMAAVMTLIFTMAECIRAYELQDFSSEFTDMAVESAFSEYNPYLWTNYKILAVDLGYGTDLIGPSIMEQKTTDYCRYNANMEYGSNYARLIPVGCIAKEYTLLTDGYGQGVVYQGIKAAKDNMASQVIDGIQGNINGINGIEKVSVEKEAENGKNTLDNAKRELAEAKERAANDDDPNTNPGDYPEPEEVEDNPLDAFGVMKEAFSKGILSTVVNVEGISDKQFDLNTFPSHRSLNKGTKAIEAGNGISDKALFIDYLLTNYSYYGTDKSHAGMKYEIEYLISGKGTDAQALAAVVEELLLIREAANYTTILHSDSMRNQAKSIAAIIAGFTMNEGIVDLVAVAIMAAWAYVESTLDVRLLLAGGHIPLQKSESQWTSDVWHLSACLDVNTKAKECEGTIGYKEYLMGFLALKSNNTLGMRACDVMEYALHSLDDYKNVKCDNMVFAATIEMEYSADEMFLSLFSNETAFTGYTISKEKNISY